MTLHNPIREETIEQIRTIIEAKDKCEIAVKQSFGSTYWFVDKQPTGYETEFRISILGNYRITISRVSFKNKRQGTMTSILNLLVDYGKKEGIKQILIQSVGTKEMMNFCMKNNFIPSETNFFVEDILIGDYILKI